MNAPTRIYAYSYTPGRRGAGSYHDGPPGLYADEVEYVRARKAASDHVRLLALVEDLLRILPGQTGCGDLSREQRTLCDARGALGVERFNKAFRPPWHMRKNP